MTRQAGGIDAWAGTGRPMAAMGTAILVLFATGWGLFLLVVLPGDYLMGGETVFGTGMAATAFTLRVRHGFDPDHIAAIDNTTRKLVSDGRRPVTVGFWFALGHSTVVIVTVVLLAAGLTLLAQQITAERSLLLAAGVWGVVVSAGFLLLIGVINLVSLRAIWRVFRRMRAGEVDDAGLERALRGRGLLSRVVGPVARWVDRPWKMYVLGILFGLGFDTATTIVLFIVGGTAALSAPWYVVLVLPILFTAGMTLVDTLDGIVMHHAYAWAFAAPVRKVYYNLTVTVVSVAVAFLVAAVGIGTLLADALQATSGPLGWIAALDIENLGYAIVGTLIATWAAAYGYWRLAGLGRTGSLRR